MTSIRSTYAHAIVGVLLAISLAFRMLSPAGFMPVFEKGAVTIVACPDYEPGVAASHHDHGKSKKSRAPCPYATGASVATFASLAAIGAAIILVAAAPVIGRAFRLSRTHGNGDRPPSTGPPLPA